MLLNIVLFRCSMLIGVTQKPHDAGDCHVAWHTTLLAMTCVFWMYPISRNLFASALALLAAVAMGLKLQLLKLGRYGSAGGNGLGNKG